MTDLVRTEDQIKYMVDRFLGWKLPSNFNPDAGISFKAAFNEHTAHPMKHGPTGTNLFDAEQASAMVRYLIEGMPKSAAPTESLAPDPVREALAECLGCITAAESEGLHEVIAELRGFSEQTDRLIDLVERRLLWVRDYAEPALALRTGGDLPAPGNGADDTISLADHDEIGRKVLGQPWAIQAAIVTITAHCTVLTDKHPTGVVADLAGCISQQCLELANALPRVPDRSALAGPVAWQARDKKHGGAWVHVPYPRGNPDFEYRPLYAAPQPGREAITDEMVTAAMRAFERMSSVLRYREKDKWHSCDIMGMRDALRAALASPKEK